MTRKEQLQEIEERLKNGVEEYFTSEKYASLLRIMSKLKIPARIAPLFQ